MNDGMLKELTKIASRSTNFKYMTGCIITDHKEIVISNGWSHTGNWRKYGDDRLRLYTVHAEMHALARARYKSSIAGGTCFVLNVARKSGNITTARPCFTCATALIAVGIHYVVFSEKKEQGLYNWTRLHLPDCLKDLKVYNKTDA